MTNSKTSRNKYYTPNKFKDFEFNKPEAIIKKKNITHHPSNHSARKNILLEPCFLKEPIKKLSHTEQVLFEKYGKGKTQNIPYQLIHKAFEKQAKKHPGQIAATHLGNAITYAELNRQSSDLALLLLELGVSKGDNVALFLQRSIPMLVGMIAILKAGACYVPQDVNISPENQLKHIIDIAQIDIILTLANFKNEISVLNNKKSIAIDEFMTNSLLHQNSNYHNTFNLEQTSSPNDNCFLLFTSGTTGKPNGVQVTHKNLCNIVLSKPGSLGIKEGTKVSQILNIAFDMAAWEIWACLGHGGTLIIRNKNIQSAVQFAEVVIATPTILSRLNINDCQQVRVAAVAGEPCPKPLADTWGSFCHFYNSCGPTETTIVNTMGLYLPENNQLTIGKPTPNNTVYILDKNKKPCKIGEVGEMWAGGDCVSAGYLNNAQLNAQRYFPDPFLGKGKRMFKTGDLARWTENGELEPFGRIDDQVKVRGFRVELDSVSSLLESVSPCKKALTLKFDDNSLVAFVTPKTVNIQKALETVASSLPYYCVPKLIIPMDEFPMTDRGKIDKRKMLKTAIKEQEEKNQKTLGEDK
ncbi:amino acid adenylation domain-containing protein [Aliikangiella sp. IMCC44359]|uniref:amino acid adenylation domain-containing protein n=1 Tax=Aliikangiella sp. IMCC44359 TaxID=3459125 RepID=UPI00403B3456